MLRPLSSLAALVLVVALALSAPIPRPERIPRRNLDAERARFPSPEVVRQRTRWLWKKWESYPGDVPAYSDESGRPETAHPVYYAWWIWDDLRLYDCAARGDPGYNRAYLLRRVERWLGEENYRRGRLPPDRWWEIEMRPRRRLATGLPSAPVIYLGR